MIQQLPILILCLPLTATLALFGAGKRAARFAAPISQAVLLFCLAGAATLMHDVISKGPLPYHLGGWPPPIGIAFRVDHFSALMLVLVAFSGAAAALWAPGTIQKELPGKNTLFWCLYLLMMASLFGILVTADMFNLFVLLEVASLTGYALVASGGKQATVAGFRYLILGTIGACFYLLGTGYLYMATGTLNMADMAGLLPDIYHSRMVATAFVFILTGLSMKIALFPLHAWQPDAYTHAPSAVSVIISTAAAKTFAYVLIRIIFGVFTLSYLNTIERVFSLLAWLGAGAVILGSVLAMAQDNIKRMLAYSSIANVGYIVMGAGLAVSCTQGLAPAVVHMVNHGLVKGAMFMAAGGLIFKMGKSRISQCRGIARAMPLTAMALILSSLAMAGMPPGGGFVSKWLLILAAVESGQYLFVAVIFVSTLLMLAYFWRVIEIIYIRPAPEGEPVSPQALPRTMTYTALGMALLSIGIGLLWISGIMDPVLEQINLGFGLGGLL